MVAFAGACATAAMGTLVSSDGDDRPLTLDGTKTIHAVIKVPPSTGLDDAIVGDFIIGSLTRPVRWQVAWERGSARNKPCPTKTQNKPGKVVVYGRRYILNAHENLLIEYPGVEA